MIKIPLTLTLIFSLAVTPLSGVQELPGPSEIGHMLAVDPVGALAGFRSDLLSPEADVRSLGRLGMARYHFEGARYDSAWFFLEGIAEGQLASPEFKIYFNELSARTLYYLSDMKKAEAFITHGKKLCEREDDLTCFEKFRILEAQIHFKKGNAAKGAGLILEAARVLENAGAYGDLAVAYNELAVILADQKLFHDAEYYNLEAVRLHRLEGNRKKLSWDFNNLGVCYFQMERYADALSMYDSSFVYSVTPAEKARLLMNRANALKFLDGRSDEAEQDYLESLKICRSLNLEFGILYNYINLSDLKNRNGDYGPALDYGRKAQLLLGNSPRPGMLKTIYKNMYTAWDGLGRADSALANLLLYMELNDSLYKAETQEHILHLEKTYGLEKKEKEVLLLKSRVAGIRRNALILVLALLLLAGVFWHRSILNRQKIAEFRKERLRIESENRYHQEKLREQKEEAVEQGRLLENMKRKLENYIRQYSPDGDLRSILEKYFDQGTVFNLRVFMQRFQEANPEFETRLKKDHGDLSEAELQLAKMLVAGLGNKDIAHISSQSIRTVESTRYQLRKKLTLDRREKLLDILRSYQSLS